MLIGRKADKQTEVQSHNGIQNISRNKQTITTHDNINASHKQNIEPKNPDQKIHICSIYIKFKTGEANLHYEITGQGCPWMLLINQWGA